MIVRGITLDTGALVAIERRKQRGTQLLELARRRLAVLAVPVPVVAEWWRGRTDVRERILDAVSVEPLTLATAKSAGEALASVPRCTAVDAMVMAFAAARGDAVFTGDTDDLERLRAFFPTVRVLGCSGGG
ncbi:MAG: PIN domain-containing protein [Myxococcales bacterium]|nr:PIN domain-containing protein [Myxococcales bacterium]